MKNTQRASEPQQIKKTTKQIKKISSGYNVSNLPQLATSRMGGPASLKQWIDEVLVYLRDPNRRVPQNVAVWVNKAISFYESTVKASIGMPTFSDSVVIQTEAPKDIPTLPLDGYQLVQRTCLVEKLANSGTAAGGFYAVLTAADLLPFAKSTYFRVASVTSWTGTLYGNIGSGFAGVQVPGVGPSGGTEIMPIWSENWTPFGQGYPGITTRFPLGDFPQYATNDSTTILNHYTSLGGTGGVTNVPVIFHVTIECLV